MTGVKRLAAGAAAITICISTTCTPMTASAARAAPPSIDGAATATERAVREGRVGGPTLGGCPMFPADNPWNTDISGASPRANSAAMISAIQAAGGDFLHPDFGENPDYGIPFVVVPASQPSVPVRYTAYGDESDPGPFPVPLDAPTEVGSDRHVLVLRQGTCELFELFAARRDGAGWAAASGARFALRSNALRPDGWTSADAAGLPILPGLVRCDEVTAGRVDHAIRVTFDRTQAGYIHPATHFASSSTDPNLPAMGQRFRLRADFDLRGFSGQARVLLTAFQRYGLINADNGGNWFFQGAPGPCWNDAELDQLKRVPGSAFEAVDTGPTLH